jgi:bacteriocin biosynthesis cyclodehydratase domain-containing protein
MRIGLIGTGVFGREVQGMLAARAGLSTTDLRILLPYLEQQAGASTTLPAEALAEVDAAVMIMWRTSERLCERADELAFTAGVPWLPVVLEHPYLTIGPWFVPPHGPCFRCLTLRQYQHDAPERPEECVRDAYDADPRCGPLGHLPAHTRMAAGLVVRAVSSLRAERVTCQLESGRIEADQLLACHGCPRCGTGSPRPDPWLRLSPALAAVAGQAAW